MILTQTCHFNQIFLFLVAIPPVGCQEHSLPNTVQILRSTGITVLPHQIHLYPLSHLYTYLSFLSFSFFSDGTISTINPWHQESVLMPSYGDMKMQSTSIMCNVRAHVQPQAYMQLSRWLHTRAISQELKIHAWPGTKMLKYVELCFLYLILYIWIKARSLKSSSVQMPRTLTDALM